MSKNKSQIDTQFLILYDYFITANLTFNRLFIWHSFTLLGLRANTSVNPRSTKEDIENSCKQFVISNGTWKLRSIYKHERHNSRRYFIAKYNSELIRITVARCSQILELLYNTWSNEAHLHVRLKQCAAKFRILGAHVMVNYVKYHFNVLVFTKCLNQQSLQIKIC